MKAHNKSWSSRLNLGVLVCSSSFVPSFFPLPAISMLRQIPLAPALLAVEVSLSISAFVTFLCISVGDYRMQAWRNGGSEGWNSDPKQRIYYYANFEQLPEIATIWTKE